MIEVKQLSKSYGDKLVLDELSMAIPKGKITSLIGPNGAGKSTLLSIISRLIDQQEGSVLLNAKNIASYKSRALAQQLSILKQSNHLDLKLTVEELVSFRSDELSMAIPKGKITSLIGPNGAGKSTLLSIISRLIDQQEGSVLLNAKNIASYKSRALAQQLSILKQSNHLDLKLTVEELVSF